MKKLLLLFILLITLTINSFSQSFQSYIGQTRETILADLYKYQTNYGYENNVLTVKFLEEPVHTGIYAFTENNLCMYYMLVYNSDFDISSTKYALNLYYTRLGYDNIWYEKIDNVYIFYKITTASNGAIVFSIYPDFYSSDVNSILRTL